ncbi:DUF624 domain-containing protein [Facklamia miroungae]|uniref:Membrane protein YesL n=1 Tax=Facklamia miroungae TaxID=120956 RepID=A0A1G7UEL2_9LACT|nr:DUF624 domain-containing protein [Facklamia miroungae]NKZ30057.1 DUF624 domain-containing protein [Facklamia miroungae]SDG45210.1 Protein of unknown function, DUF624 [Facklamia miroungae]
MKEEVWFKTKIYQLFMLISNLVILNLLFILSLLPIVTIGAAHIALYASVKGLAKDNFAQVIDVYIHSFKAYFKKGTKLFAFSFIFLLMLISLINIMVINRLTFMTFLLLFLFSNFLLIIIIIFPLSLFVEGNLKQLLAKTLLFLQYELILSIFIFLMNCLFFIVLPLYMPRLLIFHLLIGFSSLALVQLKLIKIRLENSRPLKIFFN